MDKLAYFTGQQAALEKLGMRPGRGQSVDYWMNKLKNDAADRLLKKQNLADPNSSAMNWPTPGEIHEEALRPQWVPQRR